MDLRQIELFCAAAREGSFTRAAERCHVSQSAVSQQVRALETDLGCALVTRRGRGFVLTAAGEHLARRGAELLEQAQTLRYEVEDVAYGRPRRLSVGYLNRYDGWEVQGAVGAFARRHPAVEVDARGGSHDGIYQMMLSSEVDMVFNDRRRALSDDFVNRRLMTCFDYVEVSEANPLAAASELTVAELAGQTCVLVAAPDQQETERTYYRNVLNFDCDFVAAETLERARFLVAGNRAILPVEARDDVAPSGSVIRRIPLVGPGLDGLAVHLRHDYYAFWPRETHNPYCEEFADILAELFS